MNTLLNILAIKIADDFGADQFHDSAMLALLEVERLTVYLFFLSLLMKKIQENLKFSRILIQSKLDCTLILHQATDYLEYLNY